MDGMPKLTRNDENRHSWKICTSGRSFQKKVSYVDYSDSEDEDNMVGLAESVKGKKIDEALAIPYHTICRRAQENEVLRVTQCNVSRHQRLQDLQTADPISY